MDFSLSELFAPLLIGTFLNTLLLGVTSMQALFYFQTYKRDPWWFKLLIFYLTLAEFMNTLCDIAIVYEPFVLRYGSKVPFTPKFLPADAMITTLISTPVQLFMAWRIKKITKSAFLCALATFGALCSLGGGIWLSISSVSQSPFNQSTQSTLPAGGARLVAPVVIWLAFSGATDLLIIAIIAGSLLKKRRQHNTADDPALNSYINRLIRLSIQTGSLTAFAVLTELVVFLTSRGTTYFFAWDLILSKLYTNSLLTSLNSRPTNGAQKPKEPAPNALFLGDSPETTMHTISTSPQTEDIMMRSLRTSTFDSLSRDSPELYQLDTSSKILHSLPSSNRSQSPAVRYNAPAHAVLAPSSPTRRSRPIERKPAVYPPSKDLVVAPFLRNATTTSPTDLEAGRRMIQQSSGRF